MPALDSEAIGFRAASEFFAVRTVTSTPPAAVVAATTYVRPLRLQLVDGEHESSLPSVLRQLL